MLDAMGLGPVTIGRAAYDRAFENERSLFLLTDVRRPGEGARGVPRHEGPDDGGSTSTRQVASVDELLAIFYVLLALAVIVSLFGIVNTLVLATFERTQELGTLRAVGMSAGRSGGWSATRASSRR